MRSAVQDDIRLPVDIRPELVLGKQAVDESDATRIVLVVRPTDDIDRPAEMRGLPRVRRRIDPEGPSAEET